MIKAAAKSPGPLLVGKVTYPAKLLAAFMLLCAVLGGSSQPGPVMLLIVEVVAFYAIAYVALAFPSNFRGRWTVAALVALIAFPVFQLIPLPPQVWANLPGRSFMAEITQVVEPTAWHAISIDASATEATLFGLVPPIAAFLLAKGLGTGDSASRAGIAVLWVVVLAGCGSALLGLAQLATQSLFFYSSEHNGFPLGFFANRNHQAAMMAITLAVDALLAIRQLRDGRMGGLVWPYLPIALLVVTVGLLTQSRAGAALLFFALIPALMMIRRNTSRRIALVFIAAIAAAVTLTLFTGRGQDIVNRVASIGADERFVVLGDVWFMVTYNFPIGTGLGTFARAFLPVESLTSVSRAYLNHAHCEYLELLAECGIAGLAAILAAFSFVGISILRLSKLRPSSDEAFVKVASISILLILAVHSFVDYPLRTLALAVIAGAATGLLTCFTKISKAVPEDARASVETTKPFGLPQILVLLLVTLGAVQAARLAASSVMIDRDGQRTSFGSGLTSDALAANAEAARRRGDYAEGRRLAVKALHVALYNSKALQTLGEIALAQNEPDRAAKLLALSARVTWRNSDVQWWQVRQGLQNGNISAAVDSGDALLRRARQVEETQQAFAAIAATPEARGPLVERMGENPPWAQDFATALMSVATQEPELYAFIIASMKRGFRPDDSRWGPYFEMALAQGQGSSIIEMARLANPGIPIDPRRGPIDNTFDAVAANRTLWGPFAWNLRDNTATFDDGGRDGGRALHVDRTGGGKVLDQRIMLAPGRYLFTSDASRANDVNGLASWILECRGSGGKIAEVPLGKATGQKISHEFTVPAGCLMQYISLNVVPDTADSEIVLGYVKIMPLR